MPVCNIIICNGDHFCDGKSILPILAGRNHFCQRSQCLIHIIIEYAGLLSDHEFEFRFFEFRQPPISGHDLVITFQDASLHAFVHMGCGHHDPNDSFSKPSFFNLIMPFRSAGGILFRRVRSRFAKQIHTKRSIEGLKPELLGQIPEVAGISVGIASFFLQHTSASLLVQENADPEVRRELALVCCASGHVARDSGENAEPAFQQSVAILRQLVSDHPGNATYRFALADARAWLSIW